MWKMTNGLGKEVTWYSKEEVDEIKKRKDELETQYLKVITELNFASFLCDTLKSRHVVYDKAFNQIINFFKEDKKFARYDGSPVIFTSLALDKIKEIIKENDIEISEVQNENE